MDRWPIRLLRLTMTTQNNIINTTTAAAMTIMSMTFWFITWVSSAVLSAVNTFAELVLSVSTVVDSVGSQSEFVSLTVPTRMEVAIVGALGVGMTVVVKYLVCVGLVVVTLDGTADV